MKSFLDNIQFLSPAKLMAGISVGRNLLGIRNRMFLPILFFFLICSALYGQGGVVHQRSFVHEGILRQYLLYVPAAYNTQEGDWPLVINYHGYSSSPGFQMNVHTLMNFVADTAHFLIAYPQGLVVQDIVFGGSAAGWYIPGSYNASHDDVAFTDSLIDHIDADFRVDLERVHATGWSNGGEMSLHLACELSDRIASVASVSNAMNELSLNSCQAGRPFSTLLIHGTADPFFPWGGIPGYFPPPPVTPSFWASHNNCLSDSIVTELPDLVPGDNCTVTLIEYIGCDENTEVLFYRVNNGGHPWPGGGYNGTALGNKNMDINASSEIWNFFKRNPMPAGPPVSIPDNADHLSKTFRLYQNYPNPFNPATTISYSLSSASKVQLKIYNALGQEIRTLVNARQPIGTHRVEWDGRDSNRNLAGSGLYFYRLKADSFVETRKMMLIR